MEQNGVLRTFGEIERFANEWFAAGCKKGQEKVFKNCVHKPLPDVSPETLVLDVITLPELHLLLRGVNTIYSALHKSAKDIAEKWSSICNVAREGLHGGEFNGNSCRILLKNADALQIMAEKNSNFSVTPFVKVLRSFSRVVESCFGTVLRVDYQGTIDQFKQDFLNLGFRVTPKIHAIFNHIIDFCSKMDKGLGCYSEQSSEAVHADFKKIWLKYKINEANPKYDAHLLKAVVEYNSQRI